MLETFSKEIVADLETPVSTYLKLCKNSDNPSFLLESVTGGENVARYSFIGFEPSQAFVINGEKIKIHTGPNLDEIKTVHDDPMKILRQSLAPYQIINMTNLPRLVGGLVGYLNYDAVRFFEPSVDLPLHELPDGIFLLCDTMIAFDHTRGQVVAITYADNASPDHKNLAIQRLNKIESQLALPLSYESKSTHSELETEQSHSQSDFEKMVSHAKKHIMNGDILQVVLSQKFKRKTSVPPFSIYRELRRINPSPYMFYFDFGKLHSENFQLIGASPEVHVRMENNRAILRPIAGTRPRGDSKEKDIELATELLADEKERAEHVMLIDLARNDLGRVCNYGTVQITEMMKVELYSHVMHIVSQVEGNVRENMDAFDLLAATFPAGTVSGAPKIRAMQIIANLEQNARGPYAGIVGYIGFDGSMDTCIALRTLYVQNQWITAQAGAGIVADSEPYNEYKETLDKLKAILLAVEQSESKNNK